MWKARHADGWMRRRVVRLSGSKDREDIYIIYCIVVLKEGCVIGLSTQRLKLIMRNINIAMESPDRELMLAIDVQLIYFLWQPGHVVVQ